MCLTEKCLSTPVRYWCPELPSIAKRHVGWEGGQKEVRDQLEVHLFHGLSKRPQSW